MPNYRTEVRKAAIRHGINPNYFMRQIGAESNFDPTADSNADAHGIAQIVPKWHPDAPGKDDPLGQLDYAANWMSQLLKKYNGSWAQALSVYNSGKPDAYLDPQFAGGQTYNYVRKILGGANPDVRSKPQTTAPQLAAPPADPTLSTTAQEGATALRAQARRNLSDIATGALEPTEALANLPALLRTLHASIPKIEAPLAPPSNGRADARAVALARKYLGVKYTWGGTTPETGFDCSGLLQTVWKSLGVSIPRTTYDQWSAGKQISQDQLKPGDAVFFTGSDPKNGKPGHVGMYLGGGRFIEAPGRGKTVRISTLAGRGDFVGARRFG